MDNIVTADPSKAFPFLSDWRIGLNLAMAHSLERTGVSEQPLSGYPHDSPPLALLATFLSGREGVTPPVELAELLHHDPRAVQLSAGISLWLQPHPVYTAIVRSSGGGSRGTTSERASLLKSGSDAMERATATIRSALTLAETAAPGFYADLLAFTQAIALFDEYTAFRGASGLVHLGLSFFSPSEDWDRVVWAEELLHEGTHNLLDAIDAQRPLLQGAGVMDERFDAPLRPDKRPLYGNFHAVVVLARMVRFLDAATPHVEAAERQRMSERREKYLQVGTPAFHSVVAEAESITDFGKAVLSGAAGPVFGEHSL